MSLAVVLVNLTTVLGRVVRSNEVPLKTIVAALLLYGVKEFLNDIVFSCPKQHFQIYGSLFIFGPSIFLFCLSLLYSSSFWRIVTGCCLLKWREKKLLLISSKNSVFVAFMPPLIWIIYAFVEQDYYVCAKLGPLSAALSQANTSAEKDSINKIFSDTKTMSQFIAWALLLGLVIIATIFVTIYRWCMPIDPKLLGKHAFEEFMAEEAVSLFNSRIQPLADKEAMELVDRLFRKYKDHQPSEQINLIEDELKKRFPRHAGNLNAPFRVENETSKPNDITLRSSDTDVSALLASSSRGKSNELELQPMVNT